MYSVLSYCKTYAPKGNHSLQNHQEWRHFHTELSKILIALSNTWENICFSGMEHCKLMQLNIFSCLRFISKGIICILDEILKSLSLLDSWRYVWFNKYHHATFVFCDIQYIWTDYTDIRTDYTNYTDYELKRLIFFRFLLYIKYQHFYLLFYLNHQTYSQWNWYLDTKR